jgi:hypothetical protein
MLHTEVYKSEKCTPGWSRAISFTNGSIVKYQHPHGENLLQKLTVTQLVKKFPAFYGKFHYRVHNNPSLVPLLSQMNPVHTFSTHFHYDPF